MAKKKDPLYFIVSGSGEFPFDMLRYDEAFPASSTAANAMGRDSGTRSVLLLSKSERVAEFGPTTGRWNSFCWNVVASSKDRYEMTRFLEEREAKGVPT